MSKKPQKHGVLLYPLENSIGGPQRNPFQNIPLGETLPKNFPRRNFKEAGDAVGGAIFKTPPPVSSACRARCRDAKALKTRFGA